MRVAECFQAIMWHSFSHIESRVVTYGMVDQRFYSSSSRWQNLKAKQPLPGQSLSMEISITGLDKSRTLAPWANPIQGQSYSLSPLWCCILYLGFTYYIKNTVCVQPLMVTANIFSCAYHNFVSLTIPRTFSSVFFDVGDSAESNPEEQIRRLVQH